MKRTLYFIRMTKGLFVRFKLHAVFGPLAWFLENLLYLTKFSKWKASTPAPAFSDFFNKNVDYNNRYKLYKHVLESEVLNSPIHYTEFGVAQGHSFRWWLENNTNPNSKFTGFDTFTGLPEDWNFLYKKGDMSDKGKIPVIEDKRAELKAGLFQETLPDYLKEFCDTSRRNVIHMDADLYSSTYYVLNSIAPYLKKGDIIMFDEFFVPTGEFKAFTEFTSSYYIKYELIGAVNNYLQLAVKII